MSVSVLGYGCNKRLLVATVFQSLPMEQRRAISSQCIFREYKAGALMLACEDIGDHVLFVQQGCARIVISADNGRQVVYGEVGPGGLVGDLSIIDNQPHSADVVAVEDTEVALMPAAVFLVLLAENEQVMLAVLRRLTGMVRHLTDRVLGLTSKAVGDRLCAFLLKMGDTAEGNEVYWIERPPTHEAIAAQISTHREVVTRELKRLETAGAIQRHGRKLAVFPEKLKREVSRRALTWGSCISPLPAPPL